MGNVVPSNDATDGAVSERCQDDDELSGTTTIHDMCKSSHWRQKLQVSIRLRHSLQTVIQRAMSPRQSGAKMRVSTLYGRRNVATSLLAVLTIHSAIGRSQRL